MNTFIDRLVVESDELGDRVDKLNVFIDTNPVFNTIGKMQQVLLVTQLNCMKLYLYTLQERIWDLKNNTAHNDH